MDSFIVSVAQSAGGFYASLTGWTKGDIINFSAVDGTGTAEATLGSKITLGGASSFANYLDAATASTGTEGEINWFQFNGNTYITVDASATTTFADGVDSVVELVGLVDLSAATATTAGIVVLG